MLLARRVNLSADVGLSLHQSLREHPRWYPADCDAPDNRTCARPEAIHIELVACKVGAPADDQKHNAHDDPAGDRLDACHQAVAFIPIVLLIDGWCRWNVGLLHSVTRLEVCCGDDAQAKADQNCSAEDQPHRLVGGFLSGKADSYADESDNEACSKQAGDYDRHEPREKTSEVLDSFPHEL